MLNCVAMVIGVILSATFTGPRNPQTGRIVSKKKSLKQVGTIVFASNDDEIVRASKLNEATAKGYDVLVSADGTYAEVFTRQSLK